MFGLSSHAYCNFQTHQIGYVSSISHLDRLDLFCILMSSINLCILVTSINRK